MKALFETKIGSEIWKMNTIDSDTDIYRCYLMNTKAYLIKGMVQKNKHKKDVSTNTDIVEAELKFVIDGIIANNINSLIAVYSPIIIYEYGNILTDLKTISNSYILSKDIYQSLKGMAYHNFVKYIVPDEDKNTPKARKMVARLLKFGINYFRTNGKFIFLPITQDVSISELSTMFEILEQWYQESEMKKHPDSNGIKQLHEYLFNLRIKELKGEINATEEYEDPTTIRLV